MTPEVEQFLITYRPKDRMFTTIAEMKRISEFFGLESKNTVELTQLRNEVVNFFANIMQYSTDKMEDFEHWIPTMQSITTVIDNVKYCKRRDLVVTR